jgi:hypothetical protein
MKHTFPDNITAHVCLMADMTQRTVLVSPSETFGKALVRLGIEQDDILSYEVSNAPLHYEPDLSVGSR